MSAAAKVKDKAAGKDKYDVNLKPGDPEYDETKDPKSPKYVDPKKPPAK
jgi:hypothetical protein